MRPGGSPIVLGTSVVSLLLRDADEAAYYGEEIRGLRAAISFQSREEALFGAIRAGWGDRWVNELLQPLDRYEVVWAAPELVEISARVHNERERAGRKLTTADAWIAATAIMRASHDADFSGIPNLELIRAPSS